MSDLKFSPDLVLGKQELVRWNKFLVDDGFRKHLIDNSFSFGIIKTLEDTTLENFKVEAGTNSGTIKIATDSYAVDKNGELIYKEAEDNIALVDDDQWYWVMISFLQDPQEKGVVSVDSSGNLTGVGTEFETVLRGQPNWPARIKFTDASNNTNEYEVVEVISDTSAVISGVFTAESTLHYKVVGTFTPGEIISESDKYPLQYNITLPITVAGGGLVIESPQGGTDTPSEPAKTSGEDFYIARVKRNGSTVTIQDKRTEFWRTKGEFSLWNVERTPVNALIGVEGIRWDNAYGTKDKNEITIGWGMRTSNWTVNSEQRKVTVSGIEESGKFKVVTDFTDGDFDGWRLYAADGSYQKIITSTESGGQINLVLEVLDPSDYTSGDTLVVTPDVEEIQIKASYDAVEGIIEQIENIYTFPIREGYAKIWLLVPADADTEESDSLLDNTSYYYNFTFRWKNFRDYSGWALFPSDTVNGYYDEDSYNDRGVLKAIPDRTRKTYTAIADNGYIEFVPNTDSFYNFKERVDLGDLPGVNSGAINMGQVATELQVGVDKQYQVFTGTTVISADRYLSLKTEGAREGNLFYIYYKNNMSLSSGKTYKIVQDYISVGNPGTTLKSITALDMAMTSSQDNQGYVVKCIFDGTNWIVTGYAERLAGFSGNPIDIFFNRYNEEDDTFDGDIILDADDFTTLT